MKHTPSKLDKKFLGLALYYASFSKDPSTRVGCAIVNDMNIPVGLGYNGFSRESDDSEEFLNNRELKYPRTIHSEENAIFNSTQSVRGCRAYITHPPCIPCITRLSQNGVFNVIFLGSNDEAFRNRWNLNESIAEMEMLGMQYKLYEMTSEERKMLFKDVE